MCSHIALSKSALYALKKQASPLDICSLLNHYFLMHFITYQSLVNCWFLDTSYRFSTSALMERIPSRWPRPAWHAPWKNYRVYSSFIQAQPSIVYYLISLAHLWMVSGNLIPPCYWHRFHLCEFMFYYWQPKPLTQGDWQKLSLSMFFAS
jgi:hypothetical protein